MDLGLHSISTQDICKLYDVTSRTVHRWITAGDDPAPRLRDDRDHYFALADLLPRVPRDPSPLLRLDRQRCPETPPDVDLGHEVAKRSKLLWSALSDAQRQKLGQIQDKFRETIARALWGKVIFLDSAYLTQALSLHPDIIHAVIGESELPAIWESFCIEFTLKNSSPQTLWQLSKSPTYYEGLPHVG